MPESAGGGVPKEIKKKSKKIKKKWKKGKKMGKKIWGVMPSDHTYTPPREYITSWTPPGTTNPPPPRIPPDHPPDLTIPGTKYTSQD